ncbi:DUF4231 domain-containing protein [Actinophytocola algeriensis]|uniref:DUF4231 domain-containing protein n=1 Tax=Actinophytocola algeriensis TaxID=1768010 RepID=UPI0016181E87
MAEDSSSLSDNHDYAWKLLHGSYEWYRDRAIRCRRAHRVSETVILLASSAVPVSIVIFPDGRVLPAILGSLVVIASGLRSVFHWQDNFLRFSEAREAIERQRRLYCTGSPPYDVENNRAQLLVAMLTQIEQNEMSQWLELATERPRVQ